MRFELSPEQREVVNFDGPELLVSAGAGAGKTGVLVERYLRFVRDGIDPDQILAITFTRKAAAEMRERIVRRLRAEDLESQARMAETGPISTIHGFCERLLRENAVAAGLDPDFEILGDADVRIWLEAAQRDVLADPPDGPEVEALLEVSLGLGGARDDLELGQLVTQTLMQVRGTGSNPDRLESLHATPETVRLRGYRAIAEALGSHADPADDDFLRRVAEGVRPKPKFLSYPSPADDLWSEAIAGLARFSADVWRRLERRMRKEQRFDFNLLELLAIETLESAPGVRERVADQVRVVLVDEAQDLNPMQYRLIASLNPESKTLVGDVQQSIYGFRLAEPRLFTESAQRVPHQRLTRNYRSDPGILAFVDAAYSEHWRESYEAMTPDFDPRRAVEFPGVELWEVERKDQEQVCEWIAKLLSETKFEPRDIGLLTTRNDSAVEFKRKLEQRQIPCRIGSGVLYYTQLAVRDVANALRALVDPDDDFAHLAVLRSPFVDLSDDGWIFAARGAEVRRRLPEIDLPNPDDQAKLQSFCAWFRPLAAHADRLPAWRLIAELYAQSPLYENLALRRNADQLLANVRKLLTLAQAHPELGPREFAERIREIQKIRIRESDAPTADDHENLITILTVHSAKGLEFPVVVVAEADRSTRPLKPLIYDAELELLALAKFGEFTAVHGFLQERQQQRLAEEKWRVLYVALTRARERLCVVVPADQQDYAAQLAKKVGHRSKAASRQFFVRRREDASS